MDDFLQSLHLVDQLYKTLRTKKTRKELIRISLDGVQMTKVINDPVCVYGIGGGRVEDDPPLSRESTM